jgi:hypothetical protein
MAVTLEEVKRWVAGWANNNFFPKIQYQPTSRGVSSRGMPIVLDAAGKLDDSFVGGDLAIDSLDISSGAASMSMHRYSADTGGPSLTMVKSRHATEGSHTIVQNNDVLGSVVFAGSDGTNFDQAAVIRAEVNGTPGSGADMPGRIVVLVSPDGSATPAEVARFNSSGITTTGINLGEDTLTVYDEETSQSPTLSSSTPPTISYTTQSGYWTRIGNRIDLKSVISVNTISGGSGSARFSLPAAAATDMYLSGFINQGGTVTVMRFIAQAGQSYAFLYDMEGAAPLTAKDISFVGAGNSFVYHGTYFV